MPIEIREMIVKVYVDEQGSEPSSIWSESPSGNQETKEDIIEECVAQILQILQDKKEP
jgi:hypothetical protein